jgi:hypothetical protein
MKRNFDVTNDHGYVPLVVSTSGPFLVHDIIGFVTRLTRRVSLVEHLSSPPVFGGVGVTGSLVRYSIMVNQVMVMTVNLSK